MSAQEPTADEQVPAEVRERHAQLCQELDDHSYRYYMGKPVIPDAEYDTLMRELSGIEERYPALITQDSPTQKVGAPVSVDFAPVEHLERMQSLDNAFSDEEFEAWVHRVEAEAPINA